MVVVVPVPQESVTRHLPPMPLDRCGTVVGERGPEYLPLQGKGGKYDQNKLTEISHKPFDSESPDDYFLLTATIESRRGNCR